MQRYANNFVILSVTDSPPPTMEHMTLYELQSVLKQTLGEAFPFPVWINAEIGEIKVNRSSGHCYMELVEKGGANGVPRARASAVIWRSSYGAVSMYFAGATGRNLEAGMQVLLCVRVIYHEVHGLSLQVTDIDPLYTLGDMERQKRETVERLRDDGVLELNAQTAMPAVPQRLAVISSPTAAGYRDFMQELAASPYRFDVSLFGALMQGAGAEKSVIEALDAVYDRADEFDAVVIIRGGGSQSDLSCFNSYELCCHIAQFPLPVVAGIGHDKDQSIADMVSAVSLKTPTAVAGWFVERAAVLDGALTSFGERLHRLAESCLESQAQLQRRYAYELGRRASALTRRLEQRFAELARRVSRQASRAVAEHRTSLGIAGVRLENAARNRICAAGGELAAAERVVAGSRPERIMALGFSVVRSDGRAVRDAASLRSGQTVEIEFMKGKTKAEIKDDERQGT